jgi:Rho GDP-dissociation inhibitor
LTSDASHQASTKASNKVEDIMATDAGDESLQKYKAMLLGAAASGDLGDKSDPRKLVVTEFRVVFEEAGVPEVAYDISTPVSQPFLTLSPPFSIF